MAVTAARGGSSGRTAFLRMGTPIASRKTGTDPLRWRGPAVVCPCFPRAGGLRADGRHPSCSGTPPVRNCVLAHSGAIPVRSGGARVTVATGRGRRGTPSPSLRRRYGRAPQPSSDTGTMAGRPDRPHPSPQRTRGRWPRARAHREGAEGILGVMAPALTSRRTSTGATARDSGVQEWGRGGASRGRRQGTSHRSAESQRKQAGVSKLRRGTTRGPETGHESAGRGVGVGGLRGGHQHARRLLPCPQGRGGDCGRAVERRRM